MSIVHNTRISPPTIRIFALQLPSIVFIYLFKLYIYINRIKIKRKVNSGRLDDDLRERARVLCPREFTIRLHRCERHKASCFHNEWWPLLKRQSYRPLHLSVSLAKLYLPLNKPKMYTYAGLCVHVCI